MSLIEVFLVGIGLSMDAFAVSVGEGLGMRTVDMRTSLALALSFGMFQALMPVAGWVLASTFAHAIESIAHWIAFALLLAIGAKMAFDAMRGGDGRDEGPSGVSFGELMLLSIATSIDAVAVGITFAALGVAPLPAVVIIGATTFCISLAGVAIGNRFGARYERTAGVVGGVILICIGVKVLVEHLMAG